MGHGCGTCDLVVVTRKWLKHQLKSWNYLRLGMQNSGRESAYHLQGPGFDFHYCKNTKVKSKTKCLLASLSCESLTCVRKAVKNDSTISFY